MDFWNAVICQAYDDMLDFFEAHSFLPAIFLFVLSVLLVFLQRGKRSMKKLIKDGFKTVALTLFGIVIVFFFCLFFVSPDQVYEQQKALLNDQTNTISSLTSKLQQLTDSKPIPIHDAAMLLADQIDEAANDFTHSEPTTSRDQDERQQFDDRFLT